MSPIPLGMHGGAVVASNSLLLKLPLLNDIRASDHSGASAPILVDRAATTNWSLAGGVAVPIQAGATPNGSKSAFNFAANSAYWRYNHVGQMISAIDVDVIDASSAFNTTNQYAPTTVAGTTGSWATAQVAAPHWWRAVLKAPMVVTSYTISSAQGARAPKDWQFQGWDGSKWVTIDTRSGQPSQGPLVCNIANPAAYSQYRFYVTAINGGDLCFITRIDMAGVNLAGTALTQAETWLVIKGAASAGSGHPIRFTSDGSDTRYPFGDGQIYSTYSRSGVTLYTPSMPVLNTWRIYRMIRDGGNITEKLDGVQQVTGAVGLNWGRDFRIGSGGTQNFTGQIAHLITVARTLTSTEASSLDTELRGMYF